MSTANVALATALMGQYVSNNTVPHGDFQQMLRDTFNTINTLGVVAPAPEPAPVEDKTYEPAYNVKKSVTPDAIYSLIDGKPYKTLRRHLASNGLTPEEYRKRYGLADDYPMVSAAYSQSRAQLARDAGLGRVVRSEPPAPAPAPAPAPTKAKAATKGKDKVQPKAEPMPEPTPEPAPSEDTKTDDGSSLV